MRRSRLPAVLLATLPALTTTEVGAQGPGEADGRFPIWPSEIDRVAAPLRDPALMNESARLAALDELREYATEVILSDLELALTDPSPEVRNLAMQICASRRILACVDEAEQMWEEGEGSVRFMALELISQDPTEAHLELVYDAMRDPNDLIREQSIRLLVQAPLSAEQAKQARQEIVAQLGDVSIRVRRTAARSLGAMGPGEGGLALVRLLDDIHPEVAEAAAFGLGQIADPRTGPALQRALETPINANFAAAAVDALARLPGEDIDLALIDLLDTPPPNTRQLDIARAIGRRPEPGPELIAGLVERMRDPDLREPTSQALMWLGDRAVPALEDTLARGLEPDIAVEVQRLLDARLLEPTPVLQGGEARAVVAVPRAVPKLDDREAWFELLVDDARLDAAAVLAADAPAWFEGALAGRIDSASTAGQIAPWLVAASLSPEILGEERHALIWGKIASWASEVSGAGEERCLATLALGSAAGTRHAEFVSEELRRLAASASAEVRGCAALSLARLGDDPLLEALLADPSSRVRAMAAVAHRHLRRPGERARARMAVQADRDPEMRVRSSAAFVLAVGDERKRPQVVLLRGRSAPLGAVAQAHWQRFEVAGREIDVPMFEVGGRAWAIVPLPGAKPVEVDSAVMEMQSSPYHYEIYEYAF